MLRFATKSLLFCWIISIYNGNTHGALKFTFTSPVQIMKNFQLPHNGNNYHRSISDMKNHIKKVLNMHIVNSSLDKYIDKMFNFHNLNPTYVFRIPGIANRTIIFRKSDFSIAIFPNITNINKFKQTSQPIQQSSSTQHQVKVKSEEVLEELKHERLIFQQNLNANYDDSDFDDIVDENVRSEKDFINFMRDLNEDLDDDELKKKYHQNQGKKIKNERIKHDEWDELGLSGWSGSMSANKDELPKKERSKGKKINAMSVQVNQFSFLKTTKSPQKHQQEDAEIAMENLSNQLSSLLLEDEQILLNKTGRLPNTKPRWPITTTRDHHGDNDVFIGRANNIFGHSTKWKYRNLSDDEESHREGRSKRGVLHLYSMIKCATGCDPLQYKGYGCYCGFLGSGRALDGIDRCCKAHDYCYGSANCYFYTEYLVPYLWKCYRGKPLCAIDNGEWGGPNSCATKLCECDRALSKCLRHYYCPRKRPVCTSNPFRLLQNLVMVF